MKLDHFKFWQVDPSDFLEPMDLVDECDGIPMGAEIGPALYLGNPVDKKHAGNHVPIGNPELHYVAYAIGRHEPRPPRRVTFSNQFGDNVTWDLRDPIFLLVPAGKVFEGEPRLQRGDHFLCYAVPDPTKIETHVSLQDQFDFRRQKREEIDWLMPKLYGVPVEKRRAGRPAEVPENKGTHLAIYEIKFDPFDTFVYTADQLGRRRLHIVQSVWLAVPSTGKCETPG